MTPRPSLRAAACHGADEIPVLITAPASFQCSAIAELLKGQLMLLANTGEGPTTGAITGGTERSRHARGTFTAEPIGEGGERIVYRVLRQGVDRRTCP